MKHISYDGVFLRALVGVLYLCALPVLAATLSVGAAGEIGRASRARALAFVGAFAATFVVLNLYGTSVSGYLITHRFAIALAGAVLMLLEGL